MATVRLISEKVNFKSRSLNCLGTDLDSMTELQAISAVDCNSAPFGSSILAENIIVEDEFSGFLVIFFSQDSDTAKTSRLTECAKAVNKQT